VSRRRLLAAIAVVAAVLLVVGAAWFEPWRLFTERTVDEAVPQVEPPSEEDSGDTGKPAEPVEPRVLLAGDLISHEHETSGTVRVLELADGTRILRLEGLATSDGPDVHVWLSDAEVEDSRDGWFVFDDGAYHDLGEIKGNRGNQNYELPDSVDLDRFASVSLWCDRFDVSFGAGAGWRGVGLGGWGGSGAVAADGRGEAAHGAVLVHQEADRAGELVVLLRDHLDHEGLVGQVGARQLE